MKEENTAHMNPTGSGAAEPGAGRDVKVSKSATMKYCFIPSTPFKNLEDEYGLEIGSVRTGRVKLVLADLP